MNINEIIKLDNYFENEDFNFEEVLEQSKNIKYYNSSFFMAIYNKIKDKENLLKSEDVIFQESINNYKDTLKRIIQNKDSKEPFFEINNIYEIMKVIQYMDNKEEFKEEIRLIQSEFSNLKKEEYIKNELLDDLIIFSNKNRVSKILKGI